MIKSDIQKKILVSLKGGKQTELKVFRFILSQINYEEIAKQRELTDEEIITLLQKEIKKRKEAIEMFRKGKRDDLIEDEEKQIIVIEQYVPKQLDSEELKKIIEEIIKSSEEKSNMGKIIGLVMVKVKGRADGSIVASLVREKLSSPS